MRCVALRWHAETGGTFPDGAITGGWQTYIWRIDNDARTITMYTQGRVWGVAATAFPITLPRTMAFCHIGRSFFPEWYELHMNGAVREVSLYMEVFSDERMAAEHERQVAKWQPRG